MQLTTTTTTTLIILLAITQASIALTTIVKVKHRQSAHSPLRKVEKADTINRGIIIIMSTTTTITIVISSKTNRIDNNNNNRCHRMKDSNTRRDQKA